MGHARHRKLRSRQSGWGSPRRVARRRLAGTLIVLVSAAGFAIETGRDSYSAQQPRSSTTVVVAASSTSTSTSTSTSSTVATTTSSGPAATRIDDPFHSASLATYLATRTDNVTAALYDVNTGQTFIYRPGVRQVTASMAKIDILAVLLWERQNEHRALTTREQKLATKMVEASDNKAAESLWVKIGQLPYFAEFNDDIHFTQTIPNWDWGLVETTPRDQLELLKAIVLPNEYLDSASRAYEQNLMENVEEYERFGIPTGVPDEGGGGREGRLVSREGDGLAGRQRGLRTPRTHVLPRGRHDRVEPERGVRERGRRSSGPGVLEF